MSEKHIVSTRLARPGKLLILTVSRAADAPAFDDRARGILDLLNSEVARMRGIQLATEEDRCLIGLSRRMRQTLERLLIGDSEKQIAIQLKLARRTAHQYVGMLYRHFGVESRGELMAYFVQRRPAPRGP